MNEASGVATGFALVLENPQESLTTSELQRCLAHLTLKIALNRLLSHDLTKSLWLHGVLVATLRGTKEAISAVSILVLEFGTGSQEILNCKLSMGPAS